MTFAITARRMCERRYPLQTDAAVNALLKTLQKHSKLGTRAADGESTSTGTDTNHTKGETARRVFDFVRRALAGSAYVPLGSLEMTLAAAIDAPSAQMRCLVCDAVIGNR